MLLGGPQVVERSGTLLGDTLFFRFDEREALTRVDVHAPLPGTYPMRISSSRASRDRYAWCVRVWEREGER